MSKNRQYESMTRKYIGRWTVRVWKTETECKAGPDLAILSALDKFAGKNADLADISSALDQFPDVAAYEILDRHGHGVVVYPDWK